MPNKDAAQYRFTSRQYSDVPDSLENVDLAFVGGCVDDRGSATTAALHESARAVHSLRFEAISQGTYLDDKEINRERLAALVEGKRRVLLDTTTLGVGEILQVLLALARVNSKSVEFIYAEPKRYTRRTADGAVNWQLRDFTLTENCSFISVQGFAHEYQPSMRAAHVFLLGFEPSRILNAIEQRNDLDRAKYKCHVVVGVPAFQAGWEANAIRPHLAVLENLEISEHSISYCQANSIREAYLGLWDLYKQLGDERGCFYVSPPGSE